MKTVARLSPSKITEFERQVRTLLRKGYAEAAGVSAAEFRAELEHLGDALPEIEDSDTRPFVLVTRGVLPPDQAIQRVELKGKVGFTTMEPDDIARFKPVPSIDIPDGRAYLLIDVDTGKDTLNVTPDDALKTIESSRRSPLTLEEGIALVTHYPELLKTHNAFSLLGSRCGDRRVTALWLSAGRPRLGWCWAGNPHTWLGSASCSGRLLLPD